MTYNVNIYLTSYKLQILYIQIYMYSEESRIGYDFKNGLVKCKCYTQIKIE